MKGCVQKPCCPSISCSPWLATPFPSTTATDGQHFDQPSAGMLCSSRRKWCDWRSCENKQAVTLLTLVYRVKGDCSWRYSWMVLLKARSPTPLELEAKFVPSKRNPIVEPTHAKFWGSSRGARVPIDSCRDACFTLRQTGFNQGLELDMQQEFR